MGGPTERTNNKALKRRTKIPTATQYHNALKKQFVNALLEADEFDRTPNRLTNKDAQRLLKAYSRGSKWSIHAEQAKGLALDYRMNPYSAAWKAFIEKARVKDVKGTPLDDEKGRAIYSQRLLKKQIMKFGKSGDSLSQQEVAKLWEKLQGGHRPRKVNNA